MTQSTSPLEKQIPSNRLGEGLAVASLFVLVIFGTLLASDNLLSGPRIWDDNQIFRLELALAERSFVDVFAEEQQRHSDNNRRLMPVFQAVKVLKAATYGDSVLAWKVHTGIVAVITSLLCFLFMRELGYKVLIAILFPLLGFLGPQSVTWWKVIHGDGLGMLFVSAALVGLARNVKRGGGRAELAFVVFAAAASLTKESFVLLLPGLGALLVWLERLTNGGTWPEVVRRKQRALSALLVIFVAELVMIVLVMGTTTHYGYSGWSGLKLGQLLTTTGQFLVVTQVWLLIPVGMSLAFVARSKHDLLYNVLAPGALVLAIVVSPQLMLYATTGFESTEENAFIMVPRYLLPIALLPAFLLCDFSARLLDHAPDRRVAAALAVFACTILGWRGSEALAAAELHRKEVATLDRWYDTMREYTNTDDPILIILGIVNKDLYDTVRLRFLLEGYLGRQNIFFTYFPKAQHLDVVKRRVAEGKLRLRHDVARSLESMRTLDDLPDSARLTAIVVPARLEGEFRTAFSQTLDLRDAKRFEGPGEAVTIWPQRPVK